MSLEYIIAIRLAYFKAMFYYSNFVVCRQFLYKHKQNSIDNKK